MTIPYAKLVQVETRSKIFVNNPTLEEARQALQYDVIGATTNPTFLLRLAGLEGERDGVRAAASRIALANDDDAQVFEKMQKEFVGRIAEMYMPVFEETGGKRGLVFMQGNPFKDNDYRYMIEEALRCLAISPNIVMKLPSNYNGLKAFRELTAMGANLCATSGLSVSQEEAFFRAYRDAHGDKANAPLAYVTTLAGILEEYVRKFVAENGIRVSEEALAASGNLFSKIGYKMVEDEKYRGVLQGGGARNVSHFTEMVGSAFECTMNFVFIEKLNHLSPPIVERYRDMGDPELEKELRVKIPFYSAAIDRNAFTPEQFDTFAPFVYFRGTFVTATEKLLELISEQRKQPAIAGNS